MDFNNDDPTQFEKVKQIKHIFEHGFRLFSQKPKKGIKYLQDNQVIEENMDSIANFLLSESNRLDKNAIGEYLGELENKEIMYHYVDAMDYSEMMFVSALRYFLEGKLILALCWLPGIRYPRLSSSTFVNTQNHF